MYHTRTIARIIQRASSSRKILCVPPTVFQPRFIFNSPALMQQKLPGDKPPQIEAKIDGWQEDLEPPADTKLKLLIRDYGSSVLVIHISLSLVSLGTCYCLVSAGLPVEDFLAYFDNVSERTLKLAASGGTFGIAYLIHKCLMPVRLLGTATLTPILVKYLRGKGILKSHKINANKQ